jgi:hypothetical protein
MNRARFFEHTFSLRRGPRGFDTKTPFWNWAAMRKFLGRKRIWISESLGFFEYAPLEVRSAGLMGGWSHAKARRRKACSVVRGRNYHLQA